MNKYVPIYLYGAVIILIGIFLIFSANTTFHTTKLIMGISLTIAAIFALIAAFSRKREHVQFAYHEMHALAMGVYGVSILLFCKSFEELVYFTAFLLIFYTFSEIIFSNWLFNMAKKIVYKILIVRVLLGLSIGLGTIIAMNFTTSTLEIFGILLLLIGVNILLYIPVLKGSYSNPVSKTTLVE